MWRYFINGLFKHEKRLKDSLNGGDIDDIKDLVTIDFKNKFIRTLDDYIKRSSYDLNIFSVSATMKYIQKVYKGYKNILGNKLPPLIYEKEKAHDNITIPIKLQKGLLGTLIDCLIRYLVGNKDYSPLKYFKTCKESKNYQEECSLNEYEFIKLITDDKLGTLTTFLNKFKGIRSANLFFDPELKMYGEPDLIYDDGIIDVKINNTRTELERNFIQLMLLNAIVQKKNVIIYNPLTGQTWKKEMTKSEIRKTRTFLKKKNERKYKKRSYDWSLREEETASYLNNLPFLKWSCMFPQKKSVKCSIN